MAKKKKAPKKAAKTVKAAKKAKAVKKPAKATKKKPVVKKAAVKKTAARTSSPEKKPASKATRKKGVRRATMTTGIRTKKSGKKIGRSRIPADAPLTVVFEKVDDALDAFKYLELNTFRELEEFTPDELVKRLTSPAIQTVGRIRKYLAINNRHLAEDESFAIEFQAVHKAAQ